MSIDLVALLEDLYWLQGQRVMQTCQKAQAQGVGVKVVMNHRNIIQYCEPDPEIPGMQILMVGILFDGSEWQQTYPMAPAN